MSKPDVVPSAPSFSIAIHVDKGVLDARILGANVPYSAVQFALSQAQQRFHEEEVNAAMLFVLQEKNQEESKE